MRLRCCRMMFRMQEIHLHYEELMANSTSLRKVHSQVISSECESQTAIVKNPLRLTSRLKDNKLYEISQAYQGIFL